MAREWLVRATDDLIAAHRMMEAPQIPDIAAFHSQQAAEKALKGYLVWHDSPIGKTHDLGTLTFQCREVDAEFDQVIAIARRLTPFAIVSRYPDTGITVDEIEATEALTDSEGLYRFVVERLPEAVRP